MDGRYHRRVAFEVVLYDGECGLCARVVQFVLPRDRHDHFRFAALQGDFGQAVLRRHGLNTTDFDTFVLVESPQLPGERLHLRSDGALRLLSGLGGAWPLMRMFRVVPRVVRDAVYRFVATHRLRFFGRADACLLPTPSARTKFLA